MSKLTYLMTDGKLFKIGQSVNPQKRLLSIQNGNINAVLLFYGSGVSEKELHNKYAHKRVGREWFNLNDNDIEEIKLLFEQLNPKITVSNINKVLDYDSYFRIEHEIYLMIDEAKGQQELIDAEDGLAGSEIQFLPKEQLDAELIEFVKHLLELNRANNRKRYEE